MTGETPPRLDLRTVVAEGASLAASRSGFVLLGAYLAVKFVTDLLVFTAAGVYLPLDQGIGVVGERSGFPVGTALSTPAIVGALVLASAFTVVVNAPLTVIAIRTFASGATERIPENALFHRLGRASVSGALAGAVLVIGVLLVVGAGAVATVTFIAPDEGTASTASLVAGFSIVVALVVGLVVFLTHALFVFHEIAVRDRGLVGAFGGSWAVVRGNRLGLGALALAALALSVATGEIAPLALGEAIDAPTLAKLLLDAALSGVVWVVTIATLTEAYRRLAPAEAVQSARSDSGSRR